jgi:hypothetical protein
MERIFTFMSGRINAVPNVLNATEDAKLSGKWMKNAFGGIWQ